MEIFVNGRSRQLEREISITDLIKSLDLRPDRCAVERNQNLVKRSEWENTILSDRDQIEIVQFVGGG